MIKVGLTGGIGSGKTTVAHIFQVLGIPVYYADDEAKKIMNENHIVKQKIVEQFGVESYKNGVLNSAYISSMIFNNPENLTAINKIVHPITIADAETWMQKQITAYAIKEAALIFEANVEKYLDIIIGVQAPLPLRIKRVMERDETSKENVLNKIQHQIDEAEKMSRCDFVIINDEEQLLLPQVMAIHEKILKM